MININHGDSILKIKISYIIVFLLLMSLLLILKYNINKSILKLSGYIFSYEGNRKTNNFQTYRVKVILDTNLKNSY